MHPKITQTLCSFQQERDFAEENLIRVREVIQNLRSVRRRVRGWRATMFSIRYWYYGQKFLRKAKKLRSEIHSYKQVEQDLRQGNFSHALEVCSELFDKLELPGMIPRHMQHIKCAQKEAA